MNEIQRRRLWIQILVGTGVAMTLATAVAGATGSITAMIVLLGATPVVVFGIGALMVYDKRRRGPLVPPYFEGVGPDERRLVEATVNSGVRAEDPRISPLVVAHARRQLVFGALFLGSGALAVGARIPRLWSGPEVIDVVLTGFWLIAAAFFVGHLLRIRRALVANRRDIA